MFTNSIKSKADVVESAPRWCRRLRRALCYFGVAALLLGGVYSVLAYRYYSQKVNVARNYTAEYNAGILKIPEEQRAWTHYRRALLALESFQEIELYRQPGEENWQATAAYLKRNTQGLEMLRAAGRIRPMGQLLQDGTDPKDFAWRARDKGPVDPESRDWQPQSENPWVMAIGIPGTSERFDIARLFLADASLAISENDGHRAAIDLIATIDFSEQCAETPLLVSRLIADTIQEMALQTLVETLVKSSDVFTDDDLASLAARLADYRGVPPANQFVMGEKLAQDDMIQRLFTDDGEGEGWFSVDGDEEDGYDEKVSWWTRIVAPIRAPFFTASRRETQEACDARWQAIERRLFLPPWQRESDPDASHAAVSDPLFDVLQAWSPNATYCFGDGGFFDEWDVRLRQQRHAASIAVALVRYHRKSKKWPKRPDELVPDYLSEIPLDCVDGKPLRYRLVDGKPIVYSIGSDRDDDGGKPPATEAGRSAIRRLRPQDDDEVDGDWVLWPPLVDLPSNVGNQPDD